MTVLTKTEGTHDLEWLLSDEGKLSHDMVTVAMTGTALVSGTVMGKVTVGGKYKPYADGASDGTQTAVGILMEGIPAQTGDVKATLVTRAAEVWQSKLTGVDAAAIADLTPKLVVFRNPL